MKNIFDKTKLGTLALSNQCIFVLKEKNNHSKN